jgi:F-box protein 9
MHPPQHTTPSTERETEELIQFRETWKAEIQSRKVESQSRSGHSEARHSIIGKAPEKSQSEQDRTPQEGSTAGNAPYSLSDARNPLAFLEVTRSPCPAVELYRRAVELERQSQLDDALRLYRQVRKCS